ncbi:Rieske (2Fe-2S) protein [Thermomonospora umbrina]|uniref:Nitrite reductase/ring-hydroxylating ferredoxin subunit n=1 Tax=Thermomonospora umbrina TaxID=111806 RepID=A0A3D9T920_9ACTN|nr:Rieske (2Fe-2S) protein [Thermomonospora umbrina]REF01155.1 nitrite reductase/ring-hydroxylating ferredoxin subunit [Thermomonospora umbrina]
MTERTPEIDSGSTRRAVLAGAGLLGVAGVAAACGSDDGTAGKAGDVLARTGEIPVGGGKIIKDRKVVVTQPVQGRFKAFDIKCTHQGCPVDSVKGGTINCPCHGSKFAIADGSVKAGPADAPLGGKDITVEGDVIRLA